MATPLGRRLLELDRQMAEIGAERHRLLVQWAEGSSELSTTPDRWRRATPPPDPQPPPPAPTPAPMAPPAPSWVASAGPQTLLAAAGVLLLAVAALVFTAVAWNDLSPAIRAVLVASAAVGTALLTDRLVRRGLSRTAEATAVLSIALVGVLANGLWQLGIFDDVAHGSVVVAASATVMTILAHVLAGVTGTRSPYVVANLLGPIAVMAVSLRLTEAAQFDGHDVLLHGLGLLVSAGLAVHHARRHLGDLPAWRAFITVVSAALWFISGVLGIWLLLDLRPTVTTEAGPFVAAIGLAALVCIAAATVRRFGPTDSAWDRIGVGGAWLMGSLSVAAALHLGSGDWYYARYLLAATAATAALFVLLPGPGTRIAAALAQIPVLIGALVPVWLSAAWLLETVERRVGAPWPAQLPTTLAEDPSPAILALSVGSLALVTILLQRIGPRDGAPVPAAPVMVAAIGASIVILATGVVVWPAGGGVAGALAIAALAALAWQRGHQSLWTGAALATGTALAVGLGFSGEAATIVALAAMVVITGTIVVRSPRLPSVDSTPFLGLVALLTIQSLGLIAAVTAALTHAPGPVGVAVAVGSSAAWPAAHVIGSRRESSTVIELTGATGFGAALATGLRADDVRWLAAVWAMLAVAAMAVTVLRRDRRWMRWTATAAGSASWWTLLADADVTVIEAYSLPPALVMLALGADLLRRQAGTSSWPTLGPGLGLLLMPTLGQVLDDPGDLPRVIVLLAGASALAVAGRLAHLQAPLVVGSVTAALVALTQHDMVTDLLPRWVMLALAGGVLLWLSISYESQLRRLSALGTRLAAMR